eukprot:m.958444 g.958444  ORF g.958444 m.958444 type:complete len:53 (-) comp397104_c0_seq1:100-258(-)
MIVSMMTWLASVKQEYSRQQIAQNADCRFVEDADIFQASLSSDVTPASSGMS